MELKFSAELFQNHFAMYLWLAPSVWHSLIIEYFHCLSSSGYKQ